MELSFKSQFRIAVLIYSTIILLAVWFMYEDFSFIVRSKTTTATVIDNKSSEEGYECNVRYFNEGNSQESNGRIDFVSTNISKRNRMGKLKAGDKVTIVYIPDESEVYLEGLNHPKWLDLLLPFAGSCVITWMLVRAIRANKDLNA